MSLCLNYFLSEIKTIALSYHNIAVRLLNIEQEMLNLIQSVKITVKRTNVESSLRLKIFRENHNENMQLISPMDFNSNEINGSSVFKTKHVPNRYVKGFFIHGDVNKLKQIKLKQIKLFLLNQTIINYDSDLINLHCHKISEDLIYCPFNKKLKTAYNKNTIESFTGGVNFSKHVNVELTIEWLLPQNKFRIYFCELNFLRIEQGMCGIRYIL